MNLTKTLTHKEQREYDEWLKEMQETVRLKPIEQETEQHRTKRIASLKKDFTKFCRYYFEDFELSPFGWFHLKAVDYIIKNKDLMLVCEWPREHAKSVVMDIFVPLFLKVCQ